MKLNACRWFFGLISLLVIILGMGAGLYLFTLNTSNAFDQGGALYCLVAGILLVLLIVMGGYIRNAFFRRW